MANPNVRAPERFGRVAKLLSLFGFLDEVPTAQQKQLGLAGPMGPAGDVYGTMRTWFRDRMQLGYEIDTLYKDWADMAEYDIIASALDLYAEEATMVTSTAPGVLWVESPDAELAAELNNLIEDLRVNDIIYSQVWHIAAYGNNFEKTLYNDQGIQNIFFVPQQQMERHWDFNRNLIGFRWRERNPDEAHTVKSPYAGSQAPLWLPWDFLHMRRLGRRRDTEYGEAIIESARMIYKKLKMIEDAMIVYRMDVYPSRLVFNIDTGDADPYEQMKITNEWRRFIRRSMMISQSQQTMEQRYDPWALHDMIFFPKKKDSTTGVERLAGDNAVPQIYDVEYLTSKLFGALRVPKSYGGYEGEINSKNSLVQQDIRFARLIQATRRPVINEYVNLFKIHLALQNRDPEQEFKVLMPPISALEDEVRAEMMATQMDVLARMQEIGEGFGLPKKDWADYILKNYLHMPNDIVDKFMARIETEPAKESADKPKGGNGKLPTQLDSKDRARLHEAVMEVLKKDPALNKRIQNIERRMDGRMLRSTSAEKLDSKMLEQMDVERKAGRLHSDANFPMGERYDFDKGKRSTDVPAVPDVRAAEVADVAG